MLKNIGILFERRKKILNRSQDKTAQIKVLLGGFLKEKFGDSLRGYSLGINYNSKENSLVISTENRIIASELSLLLADLNDVLKKDGVRVNRILIR